MKLMTSIIITSLIGLFLFFWIAGTKITFNPFKIQILQFWYAVAWLCFILSFIAIVTMSSLKEYKRGFKEGFKSNEILTMDSIEKAIKDIESNKN